MILSIMTEHTKNTWLHAGSVNLRKEVALDIYIASLATKCWWVCQQAVGKRTVCAAALRTGSIETFCGSGWPEIIPLYEEAERPLPALGAQSLASGCLAPSQAGPWALRGGWLALRQLRAWPGPHLTSQRKSGESSRLYDFFFTSPLFFFFFPLHSDSGIHTGLSGNYLKSQAINELMTGLLGKVILCYPKMHFTFLSLFKQ